MDTISVRGAPAEYVSGSGILDQLETKLLERGFRKVLIVHGRKSWQAARPYWPSFRTVTFEEYTYGGECSFSEIERVEKLIRAASYDAVIGVGGGKVLDLVKAAAHLARKPFVLIPTLASNCSAWTPISVIYDDKGQFARFDIYPESAGLMLIEPAIQVSAPVRLLTAGIGDTLAKWYEADVQIAVIRNRPAPLEISYYAARRCLDLLTGHSSGAVRAAESGTVNDDFLRVSEAIIVYGGMVGGFGDKYGRIAGAHAVHNGLTVLEETHHAYHGEKVAYGILVQLVLENKIDEIRKLLPFYRQLHLPVSLSELGITDVTAEAIDKVAAKTVVPGESIHVMPIGPITKQRVSDAMEKLEQIIKDNA
ncbi:MAG TPA: oxidoreductase [Treponema sp.]|nr:oxidoreductase [Treponema sp.]